MEPLFQNSRADSMHEPSACCPSMLWAGDTCGATELQCAWVTLPSVTHTAVLCCCGRLLSFHTGTHTTVCISLVGVHINLTDYAQ